MALCIRVGKGGEGRWLPTPADAPIHPKPKKAFPRGKMKFDKSQKLEPQFGSTNFFALRVLHFAKACPGRILPSFSHTNATTFGMGSPDHCKFALTLATGLH